MRAFVPIILIVLAGIAIAFAGHRRSEPVQQAPPVAATVAAALPLEEEQKPETLSSKKDSPAIARNSSLSPRKERSFALLTVEFNNDLRARGFSQSDIDTILNAFTEEFHRGEAIRVTEVTAALAKQLGLDRNQQDEIQKSLFTAMARSSEVSVDEIAACIRYRSASSSACVKDLAEDLIVKVAAIVQGPYTISQDYVDAKPFVNKAMQEAIKTCGLSEDEAKRLYDLYLSDCP